MKQNKTRELMQKPHSGVLDLIILITKSRTTLWVLIEEKLEIEINEALEKATSLIIIALQFRLEDEHKEANRCEGYV